MSSPIQVLPASMADEAMGLSSKRSSRSHSHCRYLSSRGGEGSHQRVPDGELGSGDGRPFSASSDVPDAAEHHAYDQAPGEQESRGSHEQPPRRRWGQRVRKQLKRSQRLHSQGDVHEADSGFRESCSFDSSACSSRAGHPKREGGQQPFEEVLRETCAFSRSV